MTGAEAIPGTAEGRILLVDKPLGLTSFDIVRKVKRITGEKTGHAGTLDPMATGLLVLCTGAMTRSIASFLDAEKEYTGTFFIGATRPSVDLETAVDRTFGTGHLTHDMLADTAAGFEGRQMQTPPGFSAARVNGRRAYKMARKGVEVEIPPREVTVSVFELTKVNLPRVHFRVVCSKGTYIRALARDFGERLQAGAYLESLRRTRVGSFRVEDAVRPENIGPPVFPARPAGLKE